VEVSKLLLPNGDLLIVCNIFNYDTDYEFCFEGYIFQ